MANLPRYSWEAERPYWDDGDETAANIFLHASQMLIEFLVHLLLEGKLSAKSLCTIAYFATAAGAQGVIRQYAKDPGGQSGSFQRHIDSVMGVDLGRMRKSMYHISTPGLDKHDAGRSTHDMPVNCPHVCIDAEFRRTPDLEAQVIAKAAANEFPPSYYKHKVVREAGGRCVLPTVIYLDGISFTRNDSIWGIFIYSFLSRRRYLMSNIRKSFLCRCGCKGWCTLYTVFAFIRWSLLSLASGTWPLSKHDGTPFVESDGLHYKMRGQPLSARACVLYIKADWAEFANTLAYASWQTFLFPCMQCFCTKSDMFRLAGFGPNSFPWQLTTEHDMEMATRACEIKVSLDIPSWSLVKASLRYKIGTSSTVGGRVLIVPLPSLALRVNDRLEPSPELPDVGLLESVSVFPVKLVFWRKAAETRVRHRCPLMDPSIGLSHERLALDLLHTLFLGPALVFVGFVFWFLIELDVWRVSFSHASSSAEDRRQVSVGLLRLDLWQWYAEQRAAGHRRTELEDLTISMLGGKPGSLPNFKAAETKHLVPFTVDLLSRFRSKVADPKLPVLLEAANGLSGLIDIIYGSPFVLKPGQIQAMHDNYNIFYVNAEDAGVPFKPKSHLMAHVIARSEEEGNPKYYATFEDEDLNAVVKRIGQVAHRLVWEYRVFSHFDLAEERRAPKRKMVE
jgi:hypothetical protein